MIILGIHDGHNCGATIIKNGEVLASVSEERLVRRKNETGYPINSIKEILKLSNLNAVDIDEFVYASNFMHNANYLKDKKKWYKAGRVEQEIDLNQSKEYLKAVFDKRKKDRIENIVKHLKIDEKKIFFIEHHLAHAAAAYYGSNINRREKTLILTCDGAGDGISASVSIGYKNKIKRLSSTKRSSSLGKIYSRVTHHLGFEPWEHEYKIMGMAPYGKFKDAKRIEKIFEKVTKIKNKNIFFSNPSSLDASYLYDYFQSKLSLERFDNISLGVQLFLENQLIHWVKNCIKKTNIKSIVAGGGVFMNVKANQKISDLKEVKKLFIFPSCGDESLSFGAAWYRFYNNRKNDYKPKFKNIYLGRSFDDQEISKLIQKSFYNSKRFKVKKVKNIEAEVAELLSKNNIVARFKSNSEWGARALGNRSILANPSDLNTINKINSMIKKRDFWMPFAPSILNEDLKKFFKVKKKLDLRYMTISVDSKNEKVDEISAALHPKDNTGRIQVVDRHLNLHYYKLLKLFKKKTGSSIILNTSFNIHGQPIVYYPEDAILAFKNSGLNYLCVNNYLIKKNAN